MMERTTENFHFTVVCWFRLFILTLIWHHSVQKCCFLISKRFQAEQKALFNSNLMELLGKKNNTSTWSKLKMLVACWLITSVSHHLKLEIIYNVWTENCYGDWSFLLQRRIWLGNMEWKVMVYHRWWETKILASNANTTVHPNLIKE
jgi:hypothetical protein